MTKLRTSRKSNASKIALPHFFIKRISEGGFILIITLALFMLLALATYTRNDPGWTHDSPASIIVRNAGGQIGAYGADACYFVFGYLAYLLPLCFAYLAWVLLIDYRALRITHKHLILMRASGMLMLLGGGCGLFSLQVHRHGTESIADPGGLLGLFMTESLVHALNVQGATLLLCAMLLVGVTWLTGLSWLRVTRMMGTLSAILLHFMIHLTEIIGRYTWVMLRMVSHVLWVGNGFLQRAVADVWTRAKTPKLKLATLETFKPKKEKNIPKLISIENEPRVVAVDTPTTVMKKEKKEAFSSKIQVSGSLPSLVLLERGQPGKPMGGYTHQELEALSRDVEQHLLDFGIQVDVVAVHPGPVITRFELQLAAGIKVSRLSALAKDLARSLSVTSVRVVEIIPGKTVVGIELPNPNRAMVCLSEVLSSDVYQQAHSPLTLALGVDIAGHPMVVDLAKMPHLLVAGTTGSGKSVGINAMILSLLFKASPDEVRLIMVDPKMLELSVYDGIPHLLTPVVTDMKEAASALRWCVAEMERRYRLMASLGVRNLAGYNIKVTEAAANGELLTDPLWKPVHSMDEQAPALQSLPYIVVVIDELADMMMVVGKKVEQLIARIAQKARAAGIHLILATQRPSVDVLTGLIKSNIPTRISFQVSSKIDSRTILDQQGAEQLLGHGDMLFLAPGTGAPLRVHGAFVDDLEVHRIANDWRSRGEPQYIEEITQLLSDNEGGTGEEGQPTEETDALYDQAVEFVMQTRKASISSVQRRFKIGYNRAARLVEEMERTGLVGPLEGGFRDVLVSSNSGASS
jgi:S-DNA-T family DNA segregation ATPase FtsK/SpoIIIE